MTKQIELTTEQEKECVEIAYKTDPIYTFAHRVREGMRRGIEIGRAEAQAGEVGDGSPVWKHGENPYVAQPQPQGEAVAWMHDGEGRVDVAHDKVKKLWSGVNPKHVEHYTIPLCRADQRPAPMSTDDILKLWRDCEHACNDGYALKFARAIESRAAPQQPEPSAELPHEIDDLIGQYWALAYYEGKTGDSKGSDANIILSKLRAAIASRQVEPSAELSDAVRGDIAFRTHLESGRHIDIVSARAMVDRVASHLIAAIEAKRGQK